MARGIAALLLWLIAGPAVASQRQQDAAQSPAPERCQTRPELAGCPPPPPEVAKAEGLLRYGPQGQPPLPGGNAKVTAFVRNNWPFVVDFQAEPGALTELRVSLYLRLGPFDVPLRVATQVIDAEGNGERQLRKITIAIPDSGDGAVRIADYEVASRQRVDGRWHDVPVRIFALGAGPRAVGSVTLNGVGFTEPSATIPPAGKRADLHVEYLLEQYYDRVAVQVLRSCNLGWCGTGTSGDPAAPGEPGHWNKAWPITSKTKPGDFIASVKAWLYCDGVTPDQYRRCGDGAAWAQGQSTTITVGR